MSRYHKPGANLYFENQMEKVVFSLVDEILLLEAQDNYCICDKFRYDVAAYVLNQFRPLYATTLQGALFMNSSVMDDSELQVAMRRSVVTALNLLVSAPGCPVSDCPLMKKAVPEAIDA